MSDKFTVILSGTPKNLKLGHKVNGMTVVGLCMCDALDKIDAYQQQEDELNIALGCGFYEDITTHEERKLKAEALVDDLYRVKNTNDTTSHHLQMQDDIIKTLQEAIRIIGKSK